MGEGRDDWAEHRGSLGQQKYSLCYYNAEYMSIYIFFKPIKCTPPILKPKVNYRLQVLRMCQCRFISCIVVFVCTALVRDIDDRGGSARVEEWSTWKISVPSSQFCCEPKTLLKKTKVFKNIHMHTHSCACTLIQFKVRDSSG